MSTFQKFIQYYKPYKKVFIFDLICAAFISLVDLAYPQILRSLTKTLFLKDASMILKTLPIIGGILFICYIFQAFCKYYVSCQGHIMGAQMERDMRRKLFDHYENLSFSDLKRIAISTIGNFYYEIKGINVPIYVKVAQKDRLYFAIPLCPDGETFLQKQDLFQGESSFEQEQSIKSFEEEIPNFDSGKDDRNDTWL